MTATDWMFSISSGVVLPAAFLVHLYQHDVASNLDNPADPKRVDLKSWILKWLCMNFVYRFVLIFILSLMPWLVTVVPMRSCRLQLAGLKLVSCDRSLGGTNSGLFLSMDFWNCFSTNLTWFVPALPFILVFSLIFSLIFCFCFGFIFVVFISRLCQLPLPLQWEYLLDSSVDCKPFLRGS